MEQFHISLSSDDIDYFERIRSDLGMSKSAFVRLLLASYKDEVPNFLKYKEIINKQSDLNNLLKQFVLDKSFNTEDKIYLKEKIDELNNMVNKMIDQ